MSLIIPRRSWPISVSRDNTRASPRYLALRDVSIILATIDRLNFSILFFRDADQSASTATVIGPARRSVFRMDCDEIGLSNRNISRRPWRPHIECSYDDSTAESNHVGVQVGRSLKVVDWSPSLAEYIGYLIFASLQNMSGRWTTHATKMGRWPGGEF